MSRVGTIILALMILLWFLSTFPSPPPGATGPAIEYSFAGQLGHLLGIVFAPIGFNWQIAIALVPGLAAREVAVGALGTVYALSATGDAVADQLSPLIAHGWSLATACSLLAWYVFAPQCVATLSVTRRETGSWRHPASMSDFTSPAYYQRIARTLEDAKFDLAFFDDRLAMPDIYGNDHRETVANGIRAVKLDPTIVLMTM